MRCLWIDEEEEEGGYEGGEEEFMKFLCNLIGECWRIFKKILSSWIVCYKWFFFCVIYIGIERGDIREREKSFSNSIGRRVFLVEVYYWRNKEE